MQVLSAEEQDDCRDIFCFLDTNNDESIDKGELATGLRALGLNPSLAEIRDLMARFDEDHTVTLSLSEFIGVYRECLSQKEKKEKELRDQFKNLDKNNDGKLELNELRELLIQGGEAFSDEEIDMVFQEFDVNRDGFINISEFLEALIQS